MKNEKMKFTGERMIPGTPECEENSAIYKEHLERYKFASKYVKNKTVLDIACGAGYGSKILFDSGSKKVYGGDIDTETIEFANKNYSTKNIYFEVMDASKLPFKNNYFDVVVSFETIEHLKDYDKFVKEINRVLKKKGTLIISTPDKNSFKLNHMKQENHFHYIELTREEFIEVFKNNYEDIKCFGQRLTRKLSFKERLTKRIINIIIFIDILNLRKFIRKDLKQNIVQTTNPWGDSNEKISNIKNKKYIYQNNIIVGKRK